MSGAQNSPHSNVPLEDPESGYIGWEFTYKAPLSLLIVVGLLFLVGEVLVF